MSLNFICRLFLIECWLCTISATRLRVPSWLVRAAHLSIARRRCDRSALRVRWFTRCCDELGAILEQRLERLAGNDISPARKTFLELDPLVEFLETFGKLFVEALLVCGFFVLFGSALARRL